MDITRDDNLVGGKTPLSTRTQADDNETGHVQRGYQRKQCRRILDIWCWGHDRNTAILFEDRQQANIPSSKRLSTYIRPPRKSVPPGQVGGVLAPAICLCSIGRNSPYTYRYILNQPGKRPNTDNAVQASDRTLTPIGEDAVENCLRGFTVPCRL